MGLYLESILVIYRESGNDGYWDHIPGFIRKLGMWYVYRKSIKQTLLEKALRGHIFVSFFMYIDTYICPYWKCS